jgi:hypothetical protein
MRNVGSVAYINTFLINCVLSAVPPPKYDAELQSVAQQLNSEGGVLRTRWVWSLGRCTLAVWKSYEALCTLVYFIATHQ